ncbi:MAG: hypothetical protein ACKO97_11395 [Actinomycetota bacterium]
MTRLSSASSNDDILHVLHETADAAYKVLSSNTDWGLSGKRPTQYSVDLRADAAALEVLHGAGCAVLSEESGRTGDWHDDSIIVVMDPLDGSTNASRRVPWYATALAAVDGTGHRKAPRNQPRAAPRALQRRHGDPPNTAWVAFPKAPSRYWN